MGRLWHVLGGTDKGGILVREGQTIASDALAQRLSTSAIVEQLELIGERLRYVLRAGTGPVTGWVSLRIRGKDLLTPLEGSAHDFLAVQKRRQATYTIPTQAGKEGKVAEESAEDQVERLVFGFLHNSTPALNFVQLPPPVPTQRKPRVLCLHGTAGSVKVMQYSISALLGVAKNDVDFVFFEGQLELEESHPMVQLARPFYPREVFRQWALPTETDFGWRSYDGLEVAVEHIKRGLREHEPVDAILGFSQGSNLATIIAAQAAKGLCPPLRCVVHFCCSQPGWTRQMPELFREPLPVPALIVRGEQDTVTTGADEIVVLYRAAEIAKHSEDHRPFPTKKDEARELAMKVREFLVRTTTAE
eukprot:TRINITY_DN73252_c0_g1_i1.p1 TRINITY_DN73252_c0_g1~~TRINITY_DN73252_c0_g1_i1.p1  ORF type:complete len:361 (-),score=43.36 TRINITY_DN73252_c0_g1_i1:165-1247(-)